MLQLIRRFSGLLCVVIASSLASAALPLSALSAESIEGVIESRDAQVFIRLKTNDQVDSKRLRVQGTTATVVGDLMRLQTGDVLVGTGTVLPNGETLALDTIDTVGLKKVLGLWRSATWQVFEFKDFSRLNLYSPNAMPVRMSVDNLGWSQTREFHYTLAPDARTDRWSIFLADRKSIHIGSLEIKDRKLCMKIYNTETGRVQQELELSLVTPIKPVSH